MKTLLSSIMVITLLFVLAAAKVLLRTNVTLGLSVIGGGIVILGGCWFIYQKL
ncbi:MAG: hypothetical protein KAH08_02145 [Methylococcales bacterium]|nr:hypothetical protein [Methylococcales bacterium]